MKKIILFFIFIPINIKAITNIEIDNNNLIPKFSSEYKIYNYYTDKNSINISVCPEKKCLSTYNIKDGKNVINIEDYTINIYKNYKEDSNLYLKDLIIDGYNIDFNKDVYEYKINIGEEDNLIIKYELSNDSKSDVIITGNGNFNKSDNIINISVGSKEYIIHAYKTKEVSLIKHNDYKHMSNEKKEIVKIIIITISCILIVLFYRVLFSGRNIIFY